MYLRLSCKPRIQRMNFPNDYFPWAQRIYWAYQKKGIQILWLRKVQILGNTETHYDCMGVKTKCVKIEDSIKRVKPM